MQLALITPFLSSGKQFFRYIPSNSSPYCDDVVVLANAKVILQGDREEVFSHGDQLEESGLDVPQITRLIAMLRRKGFDLPANIYTVDRACEVLLEKTAGRTAE